MNVLDRLAIRRHVRHQLRARGLLTFCDDEDAQGPGQVKEELLNDGGAVWESSCFQWRPLISVGIAASTTDHVMQNIQNTTSEDAEFWSSTGTQNKLSCEGLLYALRSSVCAVQFVDLAIYRAQYQHGDPLYPPEAVSFWVGPSPSQLYPASPVYPCQRTDDVQRFPLHTYAPAGGYLLVKLHGKLQQQWEDLSYYLAVRYVAAYGMSLPDHDVASLIQGLRTRGPTWSTCCGGPRRIETSSEPHTSTAETQQQGDGGNGGGAVVFQANEGREVQGAGAAAAGEGAAEEQQQGWCRPARCVGVMMMPDLAKDVEDVQARQQALTGGHPWWDNTYHQLLHQRPQILARGYADWTDAAASDNMYLLRLPRPHHNPYNFHDQHVPNTVARLLRVADLRDRMLEVAARREQTQETSMQIETQPAGHQAVQDAPEADLPAPQQHQSFTAPGSTHHETTHVCGEGWGRSAGLFSAVLPGDGRGEAGTAAGQWHVYEYDLA